MAGRGPRRAPGEYINLPSNAAADVDAYFEYRAYEIKNWIINLIFLLSFYSIVGDDDGGKVFSPEEYEEYKKRVLPMVRINLL